MSPVSRVFRPAIMETRWIRAIPSAEACAHGEGVLFDAFAYTRRIKRRRIFAGENRLPRARWQLNLPSQGRKTREERDDEEEGRRSSRRSLAKNGLACEARRNMTLKFLSNSGDDGRTILKRITRNSCFGRAWCSARAAEAPPFCLLARERDALCCKNIRARLRNSRIS